MNPPPTPTAPSSSAGPDDDVARGAVGGAAVGAAGGAIIGAIAGNAGKGAGWRCHWLTRGRDASAHSARTAGCKCEGQAQASQEEQREAQQQLANKFKRGMAVCLEARGYATK